MAAAAVEGPTGRAPVRLADLRLGAALALREPDPGRRPNLGGQDAATWFRGALAPTGARLVPIDQRIALEAAEVPEVYGRGDPGDCFLIATARAKRLPIVTRDRAMRGLAAGRPGYSAAIGR